ncbi:MAG: 2-hydroxychromene-2-carboxylate isomerase [Betaproteobacteria bacterium]
MAAPIDFYFDFSSPYGYMAAEQIDALATRHGRTVNWHPVLLGAIFKQTGMAPLTEVPIKGDYAKRDFDRSARFMKIPFAMPQVFPIPSQAPARIMLWIASRNAEAAKAYAKVAYRAYFVEGFNISDPATAAALADGLGHDREAALAAVDDPLFKTALKAEVEQAIARGVFGSPYVIVDNEPFWGVDRLRMVEEWLITGGW